MNSIKKFINEKKIYYFKKLLRRYFAQKQNPEYKRLSKSIEKIIHFLNDADVHDIELFKKKYILSRRNQGLIGLFDKIHTFTKNKPYTHRNTFDKINFDGISNDLVLITNLLSTRDIHQYKIIIFKIFFNVSSKKIRDISFDLLGKWLLEFPGYFSKTQRGCFGDF
jgi:hypothetical protein